MKNKIKLMKNCDTDIKESELKDYYLIVFKDLFDNYKMYFSYMECDNNIYIDGKINDFILLAEYDVDNDNYKSIYGKIDSVVCLKDLILTYGIISSEYNVETINAIIGCFIKDYIKLKNKETIKKLELKK